MYFAWAAHGCEGFKTAETFYAILSVAIRSGGSLKSPRSQVSILKIFATRISKSKMPRAALPTFTTFATLGSTPALFELLCRGLQLSRQRGSELLFSTDFLQQFGPPCRQEFCQLGLVLLDTVNRYLVHVSILNRP